MAAFGDVPGGAAQGQRWASKPLRADKARRWSPK